LSFANSLPTCGDNQSFTGGDACPARCQIVYMCILPLIYQCYCNEGYLWNLEMTKCIKQKECDDKWKEGEYAFIVNQVFNASRGCTISCDRMSKCDLSRIERDPNDRTRIIEH
ncbi:hypothetical protein PFISCL1PPCAC_1173, partial [Pristionchus fissidentatus]